MHIKDNIYKYGKSSKIDDRLSKHKKMLDYTNIEKIYILNSINETSSFFLKKKDEITLEEKLCFSSNETNIMEDNIKEYTKMNKINIYYNNGIEYFECKPDITIENIIEKVDDLYKKLKKNTNSTDILLEKMLGKLDKLQENYDKIELRLNELENTKNTNIVNNTGKCIDCMKEATKFATRCGDCERTNKLKMAMEDGSKPTYNQLQKDLTDLRFVSLILISFS